MSLQGLEITNVNVHPIKEKKPDSQIEAMAKVVFNNHFAVNSIKIVQGKFGLFLSFPRQFSRDENKGYNLCAPVTREMREYISEIVLDQYHMQLAALS